MIENLKALVPYNMFIGDPDNPDTHLVEVEEEWRDIPGYPYYKVSSFGRVLTTDKPALGRTGNYFTKEGKLLNLQKHIQGYMSAWVINSERQKKLVKVHRLVGFAFLPNPLSLPQINHKDRVKDNNQPNNLEWCNASHNGKHKCAIYCHSPITKTSKQVNVIDEKTGEKILFVSQSSASKYFKVCVATISKARTEKRIFLKHYKVELV